MKEALVYLRSLWRTYVSLREKKRFIRLCRRFDEAQQELTLLDMRMLNAAHIPTNTHFVAPKFCVAPENRVGLCLCRFDACDELGLAPCVHCEQLRMYRCTN